MATTNPLPSLVIGLGGSGATTVLRVKEQLYNMYNNTVPPTVGLVVLDTSQKPLAQLSKGIGITLDAAETGHLGGDARPLCEQVAHHDPTWAHVGSWLQADYYLKNLAPQLFQLEDGAGQLRQFGRLALFKDVANPNTSDFFQLLNTRITNLKRAAGNDRKLSVFITGSLAGGTGAGLFIDAAYLVRKIAASQDLGVALRGFFYLPDAFSATLTTSDRTKARPRAFAALRELWRFLLHEDWDLGYPMYYTDARHTTGTGIWRSELKEKLYDLVYIIDGQRPRQPLNNYPLEIGSSPSVADAILSFLDNGAGEYQNSYIVNIGNQVRERQNVQGKKPFVGSLGTYTIVLPMQQIIEQWAYQLGVDTVNTLLMPSELDQTTQIPLKLSHQDNPERTVTPEAEVQGLLRSRDAIIDPRNPSNRIFPTGLWPKLYDWNAQRINNETAFTRQLANYNADQWMDMLRPASADKGADAVNALRRLDTVMSKTVASEVQTSKDTKAKPIEDYRRLIAEVERLFNVQLGMVRGSGQREGGSFRNALDDLVQWQVARFRSALEAYSLLQLNGQDSNVPSISRKGKLGWTLKVYEELEEILNNDLLLLERVRSDSSRGSTVRNQTLSSLEAAQTDMTEIVTTASGPFSGGRVHKSQEDYLSAADQVLDMYRAEAARDAVEAVVRQMRDYVRTATEQLESWRNVLATHYQGLYARVYSGTQRAETRMDVAREFPSREVVQGPVFEEWVKQRYQTYLSARNALNTALSSFVWEGREEKDEAGKPRLRLVCTLAGKPLRNETRGEWSDANVRQLMDFCRDVFAEARDRESVLNYLAEVQYKDHPERLADVLYQNSGALVSYNDAMVGQAVPAYYLIARQNPDFPENIRFLNRVMENLRGTYKVSATDSSLARLQDGDDPFRLTMVSMVELLPLDAINAYSTTKPGYVQSPENERPLLHIFPAEVRAVQYEDQLTRRLKQANRMLSNRVVVLLEDIDRFKDFLMLMAHRVIAEGRDYLDQKNNNFVYYLTTPSKDEPNNPDRVDEWWLTQPSGNPSLLEALTTYIFRGEDYGLRVHQPDYRFAIDYPHVNEHLLNVRQYDTDERVGDWRANIGLYKPEMQQWLERYPEGSPKFNVLARVAVEYDVLSEFAQWIGGEGMTDENGEKVYSQLDLARRELERIAKQTTPGQLQNRAQEEAANDLIDLYSVIMLILREMIDAKEKDARMAAGLERTSR